MLRSTTGSCLGRFAYQLRGRRELRGIPTSAERLDQTLTGRHLLNSKIDRRLLIGKQSGLRGDHIQVGIESQFVAVRGRGQRFFRRFYR